MKIDWHIQKLTIFLQILFPCLKINGDPENGKPVFP